MFNVCYRFLVPYTESYGSLWKPYEKTIPCLGNRVGSSKLSKWSKMIEGSFSFLWPCDFELGWNSLGAFLSSCAKPRADIRAYTCMHVYIYIQIVSFTFCWNYLALWKSGFHPALIPWIRMGVYWIGDINFKNDLFILSINYRYYI